MKMKEEADDVVEGKTSLAPHLASFRRLPTLIVGATPKTHLSLGLAKNRTRSIGIVLVVLIASILLLAEFHHDPVIAQSFDLEKIS